MATFKAISEITKFEKRAIAWSVGAALLGILGSYFAKNGEWSARSGAVISAVAVWFASKDLKSKLDAAPEFVANQLAKFKPEFMSLISGKKLGPEEAEKAFLELKSETHKDLNEAMDEYARRFVKTEMALFIIGTLIWGFGDLPFRYIWGWK